MLIILPRESRCYAERGYCRRKMYVCLAVTRRHGRFYVGAGGAGGGCAPNVGQPPPPNILVPTAKIRNLGYFCTVAKSTLVSVSA